MLVTDHSRSMQATTSSPTACAPPSRRRTTSSTRSRAPSRVGSSPSPTRPSRPVAERATTTPRGASSTAQVADGATATGDALQVALDALNASARTASGRRRRSSCSPTARRRSGAIPCSSPARPAGSRSRSTTVALGTPDATVPNPALRAAAQRRARSRDAPARSPRPRAGGRSRPRTPTSSRTSTARSGRSSGTKQRGARDHGRLRGRRRADPARAAPRRCALTAACHSRVHGSRRRRLGRHPARGPLHARPRRSRLLDAAAPDRAGRHRHPRRARDPRPRPAARLDGGRRRRRADRRARGDRLGQPRRSSPGAPARREIAALRRRLGPRRRARGAGDRGDARAPQRARPRAGRGTGPHPPARCCSAGTSTRSPSRACATRTRRASRATGSSAAAPTT